FFFSSRRRHTRFSRDWSSDVCSSDLPNGAGKTTLLRALLGLVRTYEGSLLVFGEPPARLGDRRHMIGYVPQRSDFDRRFPARVLDVVMMGRVACRGLGRRLTREDREAALRSLELVGALD